MSYKKIQKKSITQQAQEEVENLNNSVMIKETKTVS